MYYNYSILIPLKKTVKIFFLLIIFSILYKSPNAYGTTVAINKFKNDYVDISFLKAWDIDNGKLYALFVKMKKNWKTYWRYPGDTGFAPEFILLKSKNFNKLDIAWPTPLVFHEYDTRFYGYEKNLILPIFFYKKEPEKEMEFEFKLTMGFCDDICIPITFNISSINSKISSTDQNYLISKSLNNRPINISNSKDLVSCSVKKTGSKLTLYSKFNDNFFLKKNTIEQLILEYLDEKIWFSEIKKLSNKDYVAQIKSIEEENFLVDKSKIKYTIITESGGFQKNGCKSN